MLRFNWSRLGSELGLGYAENNVEMPWLFLSFFFFSHLNLIITQRTSAKKTVALCAKRYLFFFFFYRCSKGVKASLIQTLDHQGFFFFGFPLICFLSLFFYFFLFLNNFTSGWFNERYSVDKPNAEGLQSSKNLRSGVLFIFVVVVFSLG